MRRDFCFTPLKGEHVSARGPWDNSMMHSGLCARIEKGRVAQTHKNHLSCSAGFFHFEGFLWCRQHASNMCCVHLREWDQHPMKDGDRHSGLQGSCVASSFTHSA